MQRLGRTKKRAGNDHCGWRMCGVVACLCKALSDYTLKCTNHTYILYFIDAKAKEKKCREATESEVVSFGETRRQLSTHAATAGAMGLSRPLSGHILNGTASYIHM